MSYYRLPSGSNLILNVLLGDGAAGKYPTATVYKEDFTQLPGSPFALAHVSQGLYSNLAVSAPDGRYIVVYVVYDDAPHTIPSVRYNRSSDVFDVNDIVNVNAISEAVWRETLAGNTPAGSFGEALANSGVASTLAADTKANTDTLVSRLTSTRADNLDFLDVPVSSRADPAQAASAVWSEPQFGYATPGTFGKYLDAAVSSRESEAAAASRAADDSLGHSTTQGVLASVDADVTAIRAKTANLDFDGTNVLAKAVVVTDKSGYATSPVDKDALVDKVWDEALASHLTLGSTGEGLTQAATDVPALADAVWDELRAGHVTGGTFGEALQGVLSTTRAAKIDNLDVAVSSRESEANASTRHSADLVEHNDTQASLLGIDTKLGAPVADVSADIAAVKVQVDKIGTPVTGTVSGDIIAVASGITTVNNNVTSVSSAVSTVDSKVTSIKAKTDQLSFTGPNVDANVQVMSDKTGYSLTASQENAIVDKVWDEVATAHSTAGTFGKLVQDAAAGASPTAIADAVWDEAVVGHALAGSFSSVLQDIQTQEGVTNSALSNGTYGLSAIRTAITSEAATTNATLGTHTTKLDNIPPAISASQAAIISQVDANETKIDLIVPAINAAKADLITEINANETKIDSIQTSVGSLSNNTTVRFIVPERIIKPTVGSKTYQFHLRLSDDLGAPEAPDSAPTIRIRRIDTGVDVVLGAAMTQDGVKVGAYFYDYIVSDSHFLAPLLVEATVVENGVTRYIPSVSEITEFESDLTSLAAQVTTVEGKVDAVKNEIDNPVYGLSAIKSEEAVIISEVNANEVKIDAIKAKTDALPVNPTTTADTTAVLAAVATRPNIADITNVVNLARDSIKGAGNKDNTQVFNQWDLSSVAKTSDPRFANLDATVSSRSTLTDAQVWSYATRTVASSSLQPADVQAIWAYLASAATTPGSIGKRIADMLDVPVSSRASLADVTGLLVGVAQEVTLSGGIASLTNEIDANEALITSILTKVNQILGKTNLLPADPASSATILGAVAAVAATLSNVQADTTAIKSSTDALPPDPAKESSLVSIPNNPLLATDVRLNNLLYLDAAVSSLTPPDISGLAEKTDLTAASAVTNGKVDAVALSVSSVQATSNLIKAKTDTLPTSPSSTSDVNLARDAVIARIDADGAPLTASAVWSSPSRTLTQDPASFGPDISGLAEKTDLEDLAATQYSNKMSTTFNSVTGRQEVIVWADKDGIIVPGTNAAVTIKDSLGVTKWSATLASPNADGIFRFENAFSAPTSQNYYIIISIVVDGVPRVSSQSFFTVV